MSKPLKHSLLVGVFCWMLVHTAACEKVFFSPIITTGKATHISSVNAILTGEINKQYRDAEIGFEVSQAASFSDDITEKNAVKDMGSNNFFTQRVRIDPEKTYYYRSYVTLGDKTVYGETKSFKSLPLSTLIRCDVSIVSPTTATVTITADLADCENDTPNGRLYLLAAGKSRDYYDFIIPRDWNESIKMLSNTGFSYEKTYGNLSPDTTYSVVYQIFAHVRGGVMVDLFGGTKDFVTMPSLLDGAVDMGLSVKWGSCNIGSSHPEEYGYYYAWGEIEPKTTYSWSNYKYGNGSSMTKYSFRDNTGYETIDNKATLEATDDVAYQTLGGAWRIPTNEEWRELIDNSSTIWTTINGVKGILFTSKKSGNNIFLPAAGRRIEGDLSADGSCYYWSSVVNMGRQKQDCAHGYGPRTGDYYRCYGFSVRPVTE